MTLSVGGLQSDIESPIMLPPEQIESWRRNVIGRLEVLGSKARQIQQSLEAKELRELEDKSDVVSTWERIKDLFPEDLVPARAGDLNRHMHFAQIGDFYDIEHLDVPAVAESVRRYGRGNQQLIEQEINNLEVDIGSWELLHPQIRDACQETFHQGQYAQTTRSAVELIMDELRRLTGQKSDGDALIRSVVGVTAGKLAFSTCNDDNERAVTEGLKQILQGLYKGVRNPTSHGWDGFSRLEAFQVLVMCSFLLSRQEFAAPDE